MATNTLYHQSSDRYFRDEHSPLRGLQLVNQVFQKNHNFLHGIFHISWSCCGTLTKLEVARWNSMLTLVLKLAPQIITSLVTCIMLSDSLVLNSLHAERDCFSLHSCYMGLNLCVCVCVSVCTCMCACVHACGCERVEGGWGRKDVSL